jgi:hypothetical protein
LGLSAFAFDHFLDGLDGADSSDHQPGRRVEEAPDTLLFFPFVFFRLLSCAVSHEARENHHFFYFAYLIV